MPDPAAQPDAPPSRPRYPSLFRLPWWLPVVLATFLFTDAFLIGSRDWPRSDSVAGSMVADAVFRTYRARPTGSRSINAPMQCVERHDGLFEAVLRGSLPSDTRSIAGMTIWSQSGRSGFWAPTREYWTLGCEVYSLEDESGMGPWDRPVAPLVRAAAEFWAAEEAEYAYTPGSWSAALAAIADALDAAPAATTSAALARPVRTRAGLVASRSLGVVSIRRSAPNPGGILHSSLAALLFLALFWSLTFGRPWLSAADGLRALSAAFRPPGACPRCRYPRTGLPPGVPCPECGTPAG